MPCPFDALCQTFWGAACCPPSVPREADCHAKPNKIRNCPRCDHHRFHRLIGPGVTIGCKWCGFVMILKDHGVIFTDIPNREKDLRMKLNNWNLFDPTPLNDGGEKV